MSDQEIEKAFEEAVEEYSREARLIVPDSTDSRIAHYFFMKGGEFGSKAAYDYVEKVVGGKAA